MSQLDCDPMFADRQDAGERLANRLKDTRWSDPLVLGLARGGVPIAWRVAQALDAALDVAVARKIGLPGHPEFGVGAVTTDGPARYDHSTLDRLELSPDDLREVCERERSEARRRLQRYRQGMPAPQVAGRDELLVDDGLVTGVTARAALGQLRTAGPKRLVFAAPGVRPRQPASAADGRGRRRCRVPLHPDTVRRGRAWYHDFRPTTDDDVLAVLAGRCAT